MSTEQPQVVDGDPTVPEQGAPPTDGATAAETSRAEPPKAQPTKAAPSKAEPTEAKPTTAEPTAAEPSKAEPAEAGAAAKAGAAETEPAKAEPTEAGAAEAESPKPEPAKSEPDRAGAAGDKTAGDKAGEGGAGETAQVKEAQAAPRDGDTKVEEIKVKEEPPRDPFASFAPEPERPPTRRQRVGRAIGRFLIHEWTLASLGSLALAVLMTWPTLRYPLHTLPQDFQDPALQAWQMAWSGHILLSDPSQLWDSNTFFPERLSFAFSDTLLGYAPAGMIGEGPAAAILRYNIIFVLAHALATFGAYALVRQLGAGRTGAIVAGAAYTYAPWMLAQAGHLHIVSNGGIPLALAMLARGHGWSLTHGFRPERRHAGWAFAGWLVAAWQITLGFGIGLVFAYVLGLVTLVTVAIRLGRRVRHWRVRRPWGTRLVIADLIGGLVFAATGALLSLVYFEVAYQHPEATRRVQDLEAYSPPPSGFFTAPPESLIWGDLHESVRNGMRWPAEMTVLPGYVLYALALAGIFFSVWKLRHRLLLLAGVLVTAILAMGPNFFGGTYTYLPLFNHLPGWDGLRTPGRLMLWTTLLLGILAAGTVSALVRRVNDIAAIRVTGRPGVLLRLVTLVPLLLVLVEGLNTTPHPVVPQQPEVMRTDPGPIVVLPFNRTYEQPVMLWSTTRFQPVVNGGSGFTPVRQERTREAARTFPDQASVDYLRELGVKTVVLLRDSLDGTPWQAAVDMPVDTLGIRREEIGNTIVYHL
ncbi:hypothetical protein RB614_21315 [Phytohabitans sp. ZYX-F-186]|uniref:Glycosyltransferase RgtA/B/C/D-like domain-containing protein n=1 Tax=Phytohabitans maris TaxID=3071409 RepID=A0ABU0ZLB7_9ACTN|nr:hypothetical protein [Phytohabitans sp. ZYX-F-186]MDQ7907055.1 hypothetical protein [Phytohabitans sp. ZYX-F-186]